MHKLLSIDINSCLFFAHCRGRPVSIYVVPTLGPKALALGYHKGIRIMHGLVM